MIPRVCLFLLAALLLAGCGGVAGGGERRIPFDGSVVALDPATKSATIAAGKIGDWMDAMTMEYAIKPDAEFAKLHVGDKIHAIAVVKDPSYYVTDIQVK